MSWLEGPRRKPDSDSRTCAKNANQQGFPAREFKGLKMSNYISLKEAATIAGYSYHHFYRLVVNLGMLPHYRPGGPRSNIRIRRDELETWVDKAISSPGDPRTTRNLHPKVRKAMRLTSPPPLYFSQPVNRKIRGR